MSVSHALISAAPGTDEQVPGLLEVLARVTGPRRERGRRFTLVFVLAVAVVCVLAGAKSFREIGDQAGGLPQGLLARLGGSRTRCGGGSPLLARSGSAPCCRTWTRPRWT